MINPSEINLSSLPWLPLEVRPAFPRQPAIYFAIDSLGKVQYIGRTLDPRARWSGHHRYNELLAIGGIKIAYLFVDKPELMPELEVALIQRFDPPLNLVSKTVEQSQSFSLRKAKLDTWRNKVKSLFSSEGR